MSRARVRRTSARRQNAAGTRNRPVPARGKGASSGPGTSARVRRNSRIGLLARIAVAAAAVALALAPLPAAWVERHYSIGVYPSLQRWLTPLSNRLSPLSAGDLLGLVLVLGLVAWSIHGFRAARPGRRGRALVSQLLNVAVLAAGVYLAFMALWGLNYRRQPLTLKLDWDGARIDARAHRRFARQGIERLDADAAEAHRVPWPAGAALARALKPSFDATVQDLGHRGGIAAALPKTSLMQPYLQAAGIAGFTNPFGEEVILDATLLPFERPFTLAHEWAHLAGFADESEASFVALLACARSESAAVRYSGWLSLYHEGYLSVPAAAQRETGKTGGPRMPGRPGAPREPGRPGVPREPATPGAPRSAPSEEESAEDGPLPPIAPQALADSRAIAERIERHRIESVSRLGWIVYDRYLKASGVREGIESYSRVMQLLLGARFGPGWVPVKRSEPQGSRALRSGSAAQHDEDRIRE